MPRGRMNKPQMPSTATLKKARAIFDVIEDELAMEGWDPGDFIFLVSADLMERIAEIIQNGE